MWLLVCLKSIPKTVKCIWITESSTKEFFARTVWIKQNQWYQSSMWSLCAVLYDLLLLFHTLSLSLSLFYTLLCLRSSEMFTKPPGCHSATLTCIKLSHTEKHTHTHTCICYYASGTTLQLFRCKGTTHFLLADDSYTTGHRNTSVSSSTSYIQLATAVPQSETFNRKPTIWV